jgi:hypothetical protein
MYLNILYRVAPDTILFLPDIRLAGYAANLKTGYWISGKAGYRKASENNNPSQT